VSTFIEAYEEIAPMAVRAGQQAKSITVFDDRVTTQPRLESMVRGSGSKRAVYTELGKSVVNATSFDSAVARTFAHLKQLTPARVCAVYEYQRDRDSFRCAHTSGDPAEILVGLVISNGDRVTGWAGANRETAVNSDAVLDLGALAEFFNPPLRRAISCPIEIDGQTAAVLTAYSDCLEGFEKNHVEAIEQAADCIALTLKDRQPSEALI
jgi:GAF domain-containing protein